MDMLDRVKESLYKNENLTKEIKDSIFELMVIFNNNFKEVDLTNASNRLEKLKIKKISKFLNSDISLYDNKNNILYFNVNEINKNYDMKHVLMFELLNIITATNYSTGFNEEAKLEALNIGYTEILANYLVGNSGELLLYPDEAVATNLISVLVGADNMKKAYFENSPKILLECFNKLEAYNG